MKYFYNLKYHIDKYSYQKVGDILLYSNNAKALRRKNGDNAGPLSMIDSYDKNSEYKRIIKEYEKTFRNNHNSFSLLFDNSNSGSKIKTRNLRLSAMLKRESSSRKMFYKTKNYFNKFNLENQKITDKKEQLYKSLLFKKFPWLEDEIYNLDKTYKERDLIRNNMNTTKKKIICISKDKNTMNFTKNINLKIRIMKNLENKKNLKKKVLKNIHMRLGENEYKEIQKMVENREYNVEIDKDEDPFLSIKNDYKSNFKRLKRETGFYPYNYLEEHKKIEPDAFKFIVNNFNSKFSLFGNGSITNVRYKPKFKKVNISKNDKQNHQFINRFKI